MQRAGSKVFDKKMEGKKARSRAADGKKVVEFVGDVKKELKRIEWTSRDELRSYTKIVLAGIFLFGMFIYFVDLGIQGILNAIRFLVS